MDELDESPLVKSEHHSGRIFRKGNLLIPLREEGDIFGFQMFGEFPEIEFNYLECILVRLFEFFILHDGSCYIYQAIDFFVKKRIVFRSCLDNSVIHSFKITLDGGNGSFDFMTQIREQIGTDFLLPREILVEGIDGSDKRAEFILFFVLDLFISFPRNDIGEVLDDETYGTKRFVHPKPRNYQHYQNDDDI